MLNFELVSTNAGDAASCLGDELVHRRRGDAAAAAVDPEELPVRGELGDRAQAGGGHGGAVGEVDLRRPGRGASAFLTWKCFSTFDIRAYPWGMCRLDEEEKKGHVSRSLERS